MGIERPAGKTDIRGAIVAVALHQILSAANRANRKAPCESFPIGDNVGPNAEILLRPAKREAEAAKTSSKISTI